MKINQLTNLKSIIHCKFIELLLAIDTGEFLSKFYPADSINLILPKLTLDHSLNYYFIPNYLSLDDVYTLLMHG